MSESRRSTLDALFQLGIEGCRVGDWEIGLQALLSAASRAPAGDPLPSLVYSYVGCGLALVDGQLYSGVEVCRWAARHGDRTPEHLLNLARASLAAEDRRTALEALEEGLAEDPQDRDLGDLRRQLGRRGRRVLAFLPREHPLNRWLGKARHRVLRAA